MKGLVGKVSANKMTGTVAVTVDTFKMHPVYKKRLRRSKTFLAKAEETFQLGDLVYITEVRPVSKLVHFKVAGVIARAQVLTDIKHATKDVTEVDTESEATPAKPHAKEKENEAATDQKEDVKEASNKDQVSGRKSSSREDRGKDKS